MQDSTTIQRITDDRDPERCQHINAVGQCSNKAVTGGSYCLVHGGNKQLQKNEAAGLRNYRLTKYRTRLAEARNSSSIKDLRDEIAILRILLEEKFNAIDTTNQLILQSGSIADLVLKIEKLVMSCMKLEEKTGVMLDKEHVLTMAEGIINIISKNIEDQDLLNTIANEIQAVIE